MYILRTIEEVITLRMRELRGKRTQTEMAELLSVPLRTYQALEGGTVPRPETRKLIAEKLGISETYLFLDPELAIPTIEQALEMVRKAALSPGQTKPLNSMVAEVLATIERNPALAQIAFDAVVGLDSIDEETQRSPGPLKSTRR